MHLNVKNIVVHKIYFTMMMIQYIHQSRRVEKDFSQKPFSTRFVNWHVHVLDASLSAYFFLEGGRGGMDLISSCMHSVIRIIKWHFVKFKRFIYISFTISNNSKIQQIKKFLQQIVMLKQMTVR